MKKENLIKELEKYYLMSEEDKKYYRSLSIEELKYQLKMCREVAFDEMFKIENQSVEEFINNEMKF